MRPVIGAPMRILYEPTSLGFTLEYSGGAEMTSTGEPPFLTWSEGTVGEGVPTPLSKWVLLSWPDLRPPILFCFSTPTSVTSNRTANGFRLQIPQFAGVIRVRQPFGLDATATKSAADFGALVAKVKPLIEWNSRAAPILKDAQAREDSNGIVVSWKFDKPYAILPPPLLRAAAKNLAKILSKTISIGKSPAILAADGNVISAKFFAKRLKPGAAVVTDAQVSDAPAYIPAMDCAKIAQASIAFLSGNGSAGTMIDLASAFAEYDGSFVADGETCIVAAQSLSQQARNQKSTQLLNLLDTLDWSTWQPYGKDALEKAEAGAYLSIAGAFRQNIEERALAAMANAGCEVGPYASLRNAIYSDGPAPDWFALTSPVRVLTPGASAGVGKKGIEVVGDASSVEGFYLELLTDAPLKLIAKSNISSILVTSAQLHTTYYVVPKKIGAWRIIVSRLGKARPIPKAAPSPRYSEGQR